LYQIREGVFPRAASGRSLSLGRDEGITRVLFDENTHRIIGYAIVGPNAGDLIAEAALAIEMGADAEGIGLTIYPHRRVNRKPEDPTGFGRRRRPSPSGRSRMTRECHVRICRRLGVKLPGSTRRSVRSEW
jgi:hypothetical protein